jgi:hypothetical protein
LNGWSSEAWCNGISDAKRDRVHCAGALLGILEEPAHLKPPTAKI